MHDAYEVLDDLHRAGVHIIVVNGDRLQWRCDPDRPPVPGARFLELQDHKAEITRVLLDVPAGCRVPNVCTRLGICARELETRACTARTESEAA